METTQKELFDIEPPNTDPVVEDNQGEKAILSTQKKTELLQRLNTQPSEIKKEILTQANPQYIDTTPVSLTAVQPCQMIYNHTPKILAEKLQQTSGLKIIARDPSIINDFMENGTQCEKHSIDTKVETLNFIQRWSMSSYSAVWQDLCAGIYKQLTTGNTFLDFQETFIKDEATGRQKTNNYTVIMTFPQILKCAFGGLVDKDGVFLRGYSELLKNTTYKELLEIFTHKKAEPSLLAYKAEKHEETGEIIPAILMQYTPLHIRAIANGLFQVELEPFFFPLYIKDGKPLKASERFLTQIAGAYSLCVVGRNILASQTNTSQPRATTAFRYYSIMQGAYQYQNIMGIKIEQGQNRINIRVNKKGMIDLFPTQTPVKNGKRKFYFDEIKQQASNCGKIIRTGLEGTGLLKELAYSSNADSLFIPAIDKPVQYLKEYDKALIVKADNIKRFR